MLAEGDDPPTLRDIILIHLPSRPCETGKVSTMWIQKRDSSGFSLIEVLIVIAIMSIVALGVATLMQNISTATSTQKYNYETNASHEEVRSLISDPVACANSFQGANLVVSPPGVMLVNFTALRDAANVVRFQTQAANPLLSTYGDRAGNITDIRIDGYRDTPGFPNYGVANLRISYNTVTGVLGTQTLSRLILLQTKKDAANNIVNCVGLAKMEDGLWQYVPNTLFKAFFQGQVGIGDANPVHSLDVKSNAAGEVLAWGDTATNPQSALTTDQGGAIELGATAVTGSNPVAGNTPYVDFHFGNGLTQDYNMRVINAGDGVLGVNGFFGGAAKEIARFQYAGGNAYYLGIGTTAPTTALQVNGTITTNNLAADPTAGLIIKTNANGFGLTTGSIYIQSPAGNIFEIGGGTAVANSWIRSGGGDGSTFANIQVVDGGGGQSLALNPVGGNVQIGAGPPSYLLDVAGDINSATRLRVGGNIVCTSTACLGPSDRRLKENIQPLRDSLETVLNLQGVRYEWIDKNKFGGGSHVGLIAQDVEKLYPEVVVTDPKTGLKGIAYGNLVGPLVEAVKSLYARLVAIEARAEDIFKRLSRSLSEHDRALADLRKRVEKSELENARLKAYLCAKDPKVNFCN